MAIPVNTQSVIAATLAAYGNNGEAWDALTTEQNLLFMFKNFGRSTGTMTNPNISDEWEEQGALILVNGGKDVREIVNLVANTNIAFISASSTPAFDNVDPMREAIYPWYDIYGNAPVYDFDIQRNSGTEAQIISLIESIKKATVASTANLVGQALWNETDDTMFKGIPALITDDGVATGADTVGGLDTATYPNWMNQFVNVATAVADTTPDDLYMATDKLLRLCTVGNRTPDLLVCGEDLYAKYKLMLLKNSRVVIESDTKTKSVGARYTKFDEQTYILYSSECPVGRVYALNTDEIKFYCHKRMNFTIGEGKRHPTMPVTNYPITLMATLSVRNRKALGVLVFPAATPAE